MFLVSQEDTLWVSLIIANTQMRRHVPNTRVTTRTGQLLARVCCAAEQRRVLIQVSTVWCDDDRDERSRFGYT